MSNKYVKLKEHLADAFRNDKIDEVTLGMSQIDRLVSGGLPNSAKTKTWWANSGSAKKPTPQAKAWHESGCFVAEIDLEGKDRRVVFHRGKSDHGDVYFSVTPDAPVDHPPLTLEWSWVRLGEVKRKTSSLHPDAKQQLQFPGPPEGSGIYCFRFQVGDTIYSYVGKAASFDVRFKAYRCAKAPTEEHVESLLQSSLEAGHKPELFVAQGASLTLGGVTPVVSWKRDVNSHLSLVLLEHAAIECERQAGRVLVNRVRKADKTGA